MKRTLRVAMTVLVALLAGGTASVATAAEPTSAVAAPTTDACATTADGYAPAGACQLVIAQAQPTCAGDVPVLDYALAEEGTSVATATITWVNPTGGADVVLTDQPLSGRLVWPGVTVVDGTASGWPGWVQDDQGSWSEGGSYAWARGAVQVKFEVNPSATTTVTYPGDAQCAGPEFESFVLSAPDDSSSGVLASGDVPSSGVQSATQTGFMSGVLAATGADGVGPLLVVAVILLIGGVVLLVLRRRRQEV